MRDIDRLMDSQENQGTRLTKVEEAVVSLQRMMERSETQFDAIMQKLEQLPRCLALIESHGAMLEQIVPRSEVEARLRNAEERLRTLEQKRN